METRFDSGGPKPLKIDIHRGDLWVQTHAANFDQDAKTPHKISHTTIEQQELRIKQGTSCTLTGTWQFTVYQRLR